MGQPEASPGPHPASIHPLEHIQRGLPSVPAGPGGGEAVQRGAAAERGEEHPEERRQSADGSAAAAAGTHARSQTTKEFVQGHPLPLTGGPGKR